jgi:hypothetical protein
MRSSLVGRIKSHHQKPLTKISSEEKTSNMVDNLHTTHGGHKSQNKSRAAHRQGNFTADKGLLQGNNFQGAHVGN